MNTHILTNYRAYEDCETLRVSVEWQATPFLFCFEDDVELDTQLDEAGITGPDRYEILGDLRIARLQAQHFDHEWDDGFSIRGDVQVSDEWRDYFRRTFNRRRMDHAAHYRINMLCGWVMLLSIGFVAFVVFGL